MNAFTYYSPTEIVFGKDTELQTAAMIRKYGGTRVLAVYGGGSVVRSGLLEKICANLRSRSCLHLLRRGKGQSYPGARPGRGEGSSGKQG